MVMSKLNKLSSINYNKLINKITHIYYFNIVLKEPYITYYKNINKSHNYKLCYILWIYCKV